MLEWDPEQSQKLPEGHYTFQIREEPEKRRQTSSGGNEYTYYIFKFKVISESGASRKYNDIFVPWDERFKDLLIALGGKEGRDGKIHLSETDVIGRQCEADIRHEPNPNKPGEVRDKMVNIVGLNDVPEPTNGEEDKIPF